MKMYNYWMKCAHWKQKSIPFYLMASFFFELDLSSLNHFKVYTIVREPFLDHSRKVHTYPADWCCIQLQIASSHTA